MYVGMYYSNRDVRLEELPVPKIGRAEALMRVEASGICGSDVMEWYRRDKVPLVLGHEVSGRIEEVGRGVKGFKKGQRIVATHHVPCFKCAYCRSGHPTVCDTLRSTKFFPGGFAQYIRLPSINLKFGTFLLPRNVTAEEATFIEPLGCVLRGQRLAGMKKGKTVAVIGSGIAGLLHIKTAKFFGAKKIFATDIDAYRLKMAKKFGATAAWKAGNNIPLKIKALNGGRLADLVILCAGAESAFLEGLQSVERGGVVLIFTAAKEDARLPLSTNEIFWRNEVTVLSSYAAAPKDLKEALNLISQKRVVVKDMITHRLPLRKIKKGFALTVKPQKSMKVIIKP